MTVPHLNNAAETHPDFDAFVATIAMLRAPDGCPWDQAQTHESIASNMIEEAYEAVDAIECGDAMHLREELGDVLLQVVLQSQIAADAGEFTIDDVCADVNAKMIRRHPHVFGEAQAKTATEVLDLWDRVKLTEKDAADAGISEGALEKENVLASRACLLDSVPVGFPALMQAQKISRKAAATGFEWDTLEEIWAKVCEEIDELKEAYAAAPKASNGKMDATAPFDGDAQQAACAVADAERECSAVLFSLVNVARRMGIDAEHALRSSCTKFRHRWAFMEGAAWAQGRRIEDMLPVERESLWVKAKEQECR